MRWTEELHLFSRDGAHVRYGTNVESIGQEGDPEFGQIEMPQRQHLYQLYVFININGGGIAYKPGQFRDHHIVSTMLQ
jgi:hypothetical protein